MGTTGSGPSRGPAPARPPTWARWTLSSQSHQPDSPRGRLRRQTAMHRARPPAPAPQPACAIARPPARSLPRAVSRFQGHRTLLSSRRASTGPGTRMQNTGHVHPEPPSPRPPSQLSWFPGPCSPGGRALNRAPRRPAPAPAGVTHGLCRRPGGRDDVTTPRSAPGRLRAGCRYSNEEPPPVAPRDSVHLRLGGKGRSVAACGLEGALGRRAPEGQPVSGAVSAGPTARAGASDPRLTSRSASARCPRAQPAPASRAPTEAVAGAVSSLLERMTLRSVRHSPL